jgi:hypothetical protein
LRLETAEATEQAIGRSNKPMMLCDAVSATLAAYLPMYSLVAAEFACLYACSLASTHVCSSLRMCA